MNDFLNSPAGDFLVHTIASLIAAAVLAVPMAYAFQWGWLRTACGIFTVVLLLEYGVDYLLRIYRKFQRER